MSTASAIQMDAVEKYLGSFHLGPLTASVPTGVVVALIGNNGAGKTTLLDLLMGLARPNAGRVRILGLEHPQEAASIKARTAYVTPDLDFSDWGTVERALAFVRGFYPDWDQRHCERLLEDFRLSRFAEIKSFSFGERMKFLLVTALSRCAELILLDEPTVGLDIHAQQVLNREISETRLQENRTIVISSHQIQFLERQADYILLLHQGRVLAFDRIDALLDNFLRLDVLVDRPGALPEIAGLQLIDLSAGRARFMLDRRRAWRQDLEVRGFRVIEEGPMTLDELLVALTREH